MGKMKLAFKRSIQGLLEFLVFFPILLGAAIYIGPHIKMEMFFLYLYLLCLGGTFVRGVFGIKNRWLELLFGMGFLFVLSYISKLSGLKAIVFFIVGIVWYSRGILYMEADWEEIFPRQMWWIALVIYMLGVFVYSRVLIVTDYLPYIIGCGFVQVIISLYVLNTRQLGDATLVRDKKPIVSSSIRRQNNILLIITILIILIIASFNTIKDFIKLTIKQLFTCIVNILMKIASLSDTEGMTDKSSGGTPELPFTDEVVPPNPIVELILRILGIILTTVGIIVLLYIIYKGIKKLVSIISLWIKNLLREEELYEDSYGYIDEKERLIDIKKVKEDYTDRLKSWLEKIMAREQEWKALKTNREKVRYIYKSIMFKYLQGGYGYKGYMTPIEIEEDIRAWNDGTEDKVLKQVIPVYNRARYGCERIDDNEVDRLYKLHIDS